MEYENNIWKYCGLHDVKYFISIGETSCKWYMNITIWLINLREGIKTSLKEKC